MAKKGHWALKMFWPSTAAKEVSGHNNFLYHWKPASKVETVPVQQL